jgi:hypothetical protein
MNFSRAHMLPVEKDFSNLKSGTLVRNVNSLHVYVVTGNYLNRVTAARTIDITNPTEWEIIDVGSTEG